MPNKENLIGHGFHEISPNEQRKIAASGGKASGKKRREKKALRETLDALLNMPIKSGKHTDIESIKNLAELKGKNISVQEAIAIAMLKKALKGDERAATWVRDTSGQKPTDEVRMSGELNNPFEGLTTEELKKLVDDD